jgi:D-sedoheptulose 7-phosphate isomerase
MSDQTFIESYLQDTIRIAQTLDKAAIARAVEVLRQVRDGQGRLFVLGVGGSAGNASHAVNDFRKIAGMECYAPTDNVSELTAWTNDVGWDVVFEKWLEGSRLRQGDGVLVLSVGGGSPKASQNLVRGLDLARSRGAKIVSIVSRDGGHAAKVSDACLLVPVVHPDRITPHCEGWQGVLWHLLVNALVQA